MDTGAPEPWRASKEQCFYALFTVKEHQHFHFLHHLNENGDKDFHLYSFYPPLNNQG